MQVFFYNIISDNIMDYIHAYEYESNVNPSMKSIPIYKQNIQNCDYGITFVDQSTNYNVEYKSTSPNLLASFIKLRENTEFKKTNNEFTEKKTYSNASSHLFYVMQGECEIYLDYEIFFLSSDEIFISPSFSTIRIYNRGKEDLHIYYVNDSPLLNYLGSSPTSKIFKPAIYSNEFLHRNLELLSNPENNRKGILLSNNDTEKIGTNTITPILWTLYNQLPPQTNQKPHRHNSVAFDLCIQSDDVDNIYTVVGKELNEDGTIKDPVKINWKKGEMFITPPTLWHSHHNTGNTYAYILPIQDAGLLLYQRILGIELLH